MEKELRQDGQSFFTRSYLTPQEVQYLVIYHPKLIVHHIRQTSGRRAYVDHYTVVNDAGAANQRELDEAIQSGGYEISESNAL